MIKHVTGNILDSSADALVNIANTVGVMGKHQGVVECLGTRRR
jgi:O-acetyl-ADP-ribose deacetylase (regulator of RNase III)